jgi:hypothetical protein
MNAEIESVLTPVFKLTRDMMKTLRQGGGGVTDSEARALVDIYYQMQDQRIRINNQVAGLERDATKTGNEAEPHDALSWLMAQFGTLEQQVAKLLTIYVEFHPMAWFFERTVGIGPILAAGLLAHIDIKKAPTAGHIWAFAGLDPTTTWEKKTKRPFNADLKKLCWKIGDSFVKTSGHTHGVYGRLYRERKAEEWRRNTAGAFSTQARAKLDSTRIGKDTDAFAWYSGACSAAKTMALLEAGKTLTVAACAAKGEAGTPMLPPAHIDMRARRYAVKMFLSHLQECWWRQEYDQDPPAPYALAQAGHAHYIAPPQGTPPARELAP